jgi:DNA-binding NarL/FixJ family response regulator
MKISTTTKPMLRIAIVESDPLRLVGFRALLESEPDLELISASLPEIAIQENIDVVLLGDRPGQNLFDTMSNLKVMRPDLPIIVIGRSTDDKIMLNAIVAGAKGYVFDGAPPSEFAQSIRAVSQGSIWVPRRVLSMFIELTDAQRKGMLPGANGAITDREKQVLKMLVAGLTNKEIGEPLGIVERTVKAHISKMMRKVGVQNRIALSVHAITYSLSVRPNINCHGQGGSGGTLKPDFGLSGAVLQLDRVFMVLFEKLRSMHRNPVKRGLVASPEDCFV